MRRSNTGAWIYLVLTIAVGFAWANGPAIAGCPEAGSHAVKINSVSSSGCIDPEHDPTCHNVNFDPNYSPSYPVVNWTPFSEYDNQSWGCGAAFILDGGVYEANIINSAIGASGCAHSNNLENSLFGWPSSWVNDRCKHTLQVRAYFRVNNSCPAPNNSYADSDPITVWIDAFNTSDHETMVFCTGGAPMSDGETCGKAPELARPVNLANGRMYHRMVDRTIDGPLPIQFVRRFDSTSTFDGVMGYGWQHNYMVRLTDLSDPKKKTLVDTDMRNVEFACGSGSAGGACAGVWAPNTLNHLTLIEEAVGNVPRWRVKDRHQNERDFDAQGRLIKVVDRNGNAVSLTYTGSPSQLTTIADDLGRSLTLSYTNGRIFQVTGGGRAVQYTYTSGNLTLVEHSKLDSSFMTFATYTYGGASGHRLMTATDANNHLIESHTYDSSGRVATTQSEGGNSAYTFQYGTPAAVNTTVTNGRNVSTVFTMQPQYGVAIDRTGGPGCATCGDAGNRTQKYYDDRLNVTDSIDGLGVVTHMTHDDSGNVLTRTEAYGTSAARTTTLEYGPHGLPTQIQVPTVGRSTSHHSGCAYWVPNKTITLQRDSNGNVVTEEIHGCDGPDFLATWARTYSYNARAQVTSVDGPRNDVTDVTTYEYYENDPEHPENNPTADNLGRLMRITDALGHATTFNSYDYFGNLLSVTDSNNVETQYAYDAEDRVTTVRLIDPQTMEETVTEYHYDNVGNLDFVRDPNCVETGASCTYTFDYAYDGVNRLTEVRDVAGNKIVYTYDVEGNRTREEHRTLSTPDQQFRNFSYDAFNRLEYVYFNATTPPGAGSEYFKYTYNADGTPSSERDPENHTTSFTYDDLKRLRTASQSAGLDTMTTQYSYDAQNNIRSVMDPKGIATGYLFNDLGLRRKVYSNDAGDSEDLYDEAGNLFAHLDGNGNAFNMTFDVLNRPLTRTFSEPQLNVTYSYDSIDMPYGTGRLTGMTDASGETFYGYDPRGLVVQEDKSMGGLYFSTAYVYDKSGHLSELWYPASGNTSRSGVANYEHDPAGRVSLVATNIDQLPKNIATDLAYKPFGPRTALTFGNNLVDARSYDSRFRLIDWTLGPSSGYLINYTHGYDLDDDLLTRVDHLNAANNRTFGYDAFHRLTDAAGPWGAGTYCAGGKTYTYDLNGNRICKGETSSTTSYSYSTSNNRLYTATGAEAASYTYDDGGYTTSDGTHTYEYDYANRLSTVDGGATATYTYDGNGHRAIKEAVGATTFYFYDRSGKLITELNPALGGGSPAGVDYVYLDGDPIGRVNWSTWQVKHVVHFGSGKFVYYTTESQKFLYYYHDDHLGIPIASTRGGNAGVAWRAEYLPFGGLFSNPSPSIESNLRLPGQYFDTETGLHQNWFRDYSAKTGRYLEADPIGLGGGLNPYSYAQNQPVSLTDSAGLDSWLDKIWRQFVEMWSPEPQVDPLRARERQELAEAAGLNSATGETRIAGLDGPAAARRGAKEGVASVGAACSKQVVDYYVAPAAIGIAARGALRAAGYVASGFANGQLERHFAEHAAEWGAGNITRTGYLNRAQALLESQVGGDILGYVRPGGDILRYNARTNEFAVGAADGTIRTLFRPTDGMSYWLRQVAP